MYPKSAKRGASGAATAASGSFPGLPPRSPLGCSSSTGSPDLMANLRGSENVSQVSSPVRGAVGGKGGGLHFAADLSPSSLRQSQPSGNGRAYPPRNALPSFLETDPLTSNVEVAEQSNSGFATANQLALSVKSSGSFADPARPRHSPGASAKRGAPLPSYHAATAALTGGAAQAPPPPPPAYGTHNGVGAPPPHRPSVASDSMLARSDSITASPQSPLRGGGSGHFGGNMSSAPSYDYVQSTPQPMPSFYPDSNAAPGRGGGEGWLQTGDGASAYPPPPFAPAPAFMAAPPPHMQQPMPPPPPQPYGYYDGPCPEGAELPPWQPRAGDAWAAAPPPQSPSLSRQLQPPPPPSFPADGHRGTAATPCRDADSSHRRLALAEPLSATRPSPRQDRPAPSLSLSAAQPAAATAESLVQQPPLPPPKPLLKTPPPPPQPAEHPRSETDTDVRAAVPQPVDARYTHLFEEFTKANRARTRLAQENERVKREAQNLANELSHFRDREVEATLEKRALRSAFQQDVSVLLVAVDRLLHRLHRHAQPQMGTAPTSAADTQLAKAALLQSVLADEFDKATAISPRWLCQVLRLRFDVEGTQAVLQQQQHQQHASGTAAAATTVDAASRYGESRANGSPAHSQNAARTHSPSNSGGGGTLPSTEDSTSVLAQEEVEGLVMAAQKELNHFLSAMDYGVATPSPAMSMLPITAARGSVSSSNGASMSAIHSQRSSRAGGGVYGDLHLTVEVPPAALHANISDYLLSRHDSYILRVSDACSRGSTPAPGQGVGRQSSSSSLSLAKAPHAVQQPAPPAPSDGNVETAAVVDESSEPSAPHGEEEVETISSNPRPAAVAASTAPASAVTVAKAAKAAVPIKKAKKNMVRGSDASTRSADEGA